MNSLNKVVLNLYGKAFKFFIIRTVLELTFEQILCMCVSNVSWLSTVTPSSLNSSTKLILCPSIEMKIFVGWIWGHSILSYTMICWELFFQKKSRLLRKYQDLIFQKKRDLPRNFFDSAYSFLLAILSLNV